jgi:hypothetical protein
MLKKTHSRARPRAGRKHTLETPNITGLTVSDALARLDSPRLWELRRQVVTGTYLTPEKLEVVHDRLVEVLARAKYETERATA